MTDKTPPFPLYTDEELKAMLIAAVFRDLAEERYGQELRGDAQKIVSAIPLDVLRTIGQQSLRQKKTILALIRNN